jgi:Flp pilus assembly pilin Flp
MKEQKIQPLVDNRKERGVSLVEYSLLVALVSCVVLVSVRVVGASVRDTTETAATRLSGSGGIGDD